jgi:hypothetical protein
MKSEEEEGEKDADDVLSLTEEEDLEMAWDPHFASRKQAVNLYYCQLNWEINIFGN